MSQKLSVNDFKWSDYNGIRTHSDLVFKRTLNNHLASLDKCLSVHLRTKLLWVRILLQSLKFQILRLFRTWSFLTFRQLQSVDSLLNMYVT